MLPYCRHCKKQYKPYSIPQIVLHTMLKIEILDDSHLHSCKRCLKDEINYCTTDNEEPDPLNTGIGDMYGG